MSTGRFGIWLVWALLTNLAVQSFSGSARLPQPDPPLRFACGHASGTSQILAGAPRILGEMPSTAFCAGKPPRAFPRLVGGTPSHTPVTVLLESESGRPEPIEADPSAPLSASFHDYLKSHSQKNVRLQFYFSRGPALGEAANLTQTPLELGIEDGDMLRVREDMGAGSEVPPSWRGRPIEPGSKYARTLTYWMETLGLRMENATSTLGLRGGGMPQARNPPEPEGARDGVFSESSDEMDDGAEKPPVLTLEVWASANPVKSSSFGCFTFS